MKHSQAVVSDEEICNKAQELFVKSILTETDHAVRKFILFLNIIVSTTTVKVILILAFYSSGCKFTLIVIELNN